MKKEIYLILHFVLCVIYGLGHIFAVGTRWSQRKYALLREPYQAGKAIMQQLFYGRCCRRCVRLALLESRLATISVVLFASLLITIVVNLTLLSRWLGIDEIIRHPNVTLSKQIGLNYT